MKPRILGRLVAIATIASVFVLSAPVSEAEEPPSSPILLAPSNYLGEFAELWDAIYSLIVSGADAKPGETVPLPDSDSKDTQVPEAVASDEPGGGTQDEMGGIHEPFG